eukprot:GFYU01072632.1.p1 GENE.GFYU01072632.1~~GFYU01072632.1.p1  ORF type:complete len:118 (+),score=4.91 GFYU01072632.1:33-386(+)
MLSLRIVLFTLAVLVLFVSVTAMAQGSTSGTTTTAASTAPTTTTTATTPSTTTAAPVPAPVDEGLTQGKKFGISTAVFCCCAFAWAAFTFIYAKVVDHCPCFKHDVPTAPPRPVSVQ